MFLIDQAERFYTINFILAPDYKGYSFTLIIGIVFLLVVILFYFFKREKLNKYIVILFFVFWIPLYIISFYNNIYDFIEDFDYYSLPNNQKSKLRLGNISGNKNPGSAMYSMIDYTEEVKKYLDYNSEALLLSPGIIANYLNYYLYPEVKLIKDVNSAKYILVYHPETPVVLKENKLYLKEVSDDNYIGNYSMLFCIDSNKCLLKKI